MAAELDVRANLLLNARTAYGDVRRTAGEVRALGEGLKTSASGMKAMVAQAVAFGATYLGVRAVSQAFLSLTKSAVSYTANLEKTKIGLQSVLAAVENTDWETAGKRAGAAFEQLRDLAIKSPATSAEMFDVFNGIVGPVEAAGFAMSKVLDLTNDTVLASSALGVDFAQASRDINQMVRGTAGAEVKLFSMLRSTGAIKEDAEAWNKNLTATERVNKLAEALKKFSQGGAAFGSSWAGVTSTLTDIFDNLKASAFAPILKVMGRNLEKFNGYILEHRKEIEQFLLVVGRDFANRIDNLFIRAQEGFKFILAHWDQIVDRFHQVVSKVKEVAPIIAKAALAWELTNLGRNVAGGAISAGATVAGMLGAGGEGGVGLLAGMGTKRAAEATGALGGAMSGGASPFGLMGAGSGGATIASPFGMWGAGAAGSAAAAPEAAAAGGLATAMVALGPILVMVAAAIAVFVGVIGAFKDQWQNMMVIFGQTGGQTLAMFLEFGKALWDALFPILKILGSVVLVGLSAAWTVFTVLLRGLMFVLTAVFKVIGMVTGAIYDTLRPAFDFVFGLFRDLAAFFNDVFASVRDFLGENKKPVTAPADEGNFDPNTDYSRWLTGAGASGAVDVNKAPKGAVNINQDFRGSRISVKQEFKGDQDPDRIVTAMMDQLTRQAENRVSSGYAGALTR